MQNNKPIMDSKEKHKLKNILKVVITVDSKFVKIKILKQLE